MQYQIYARPDSRIDMETCYMGFHSWSKVICLAFLSSCQDKWTRKCHNWRDSARELFSSQCLIHNPSSCWHSQIISWLLTSTFLSSSLESDATSTLSMAIWQQTSAMISGILDFFCLLALVGARSGANFPCQFSWDNGVMFQTYLHSVSLCVRSIRAPIYWDMEPGLKLGQG